MKVKIKKKGKKKTYKFIDSWSDVNLDKWIKLIDLRTKSKTEEAENKEEKFQHLYCLYFSFE